MALQYIDQPSDTFHSVYSPIKLSAFEVTQNRDKYVSCKVTITPIDNINGATLTDQTVTIRVQPSIDIPNHNSSGNTPNNSRLYYTIDVSSICRDFLSYNLRPCTHDTSNWVRRDITLAEISNDVYKEINVVFQLEEINTSGELVNSGSSISTNFFVTNSALLHEQEHYGYINSILKGDTSAHPYYAFNLSTQYIHSGITANLNNRQKYLTTKPVKHRVIGTDECEYLSFLHEDDQTNDVRVLARFYDKNGSEILNGTGSAYVLVINKTVDGNGNTGSNLNSWADSGSTAETHSVCQVGIGTRNIKESPDSRFNGSCAVTDFSNISYYEVYTEYSGSDKIGETVRYYIDHTRERINGVRFHWQNRLGGIDSYTFDGAFTESINISSKTYEQSIYPDFRGQLGSSTSNTRIAQGDNPLYAEDYGALVPRVAGLTDDKYPSVRKSKVKAVKEGAAISRPYGIAEQDMFEDLLASPNVWIEKGWIGKEVFREDWSGYAAVTSISDKYHIQDGNITSDAAFETADGHLTGTRTLRKGNEGTTSSSGSDNDTLWLVSDSRIPYNPKSIYEVEVRIKSNASDSGYQVVGFTGFASNKTTKISTGGSDQYGNFHKITLEDYAQQTDDQWETFRGYVTGHSTTVASESHNINTASAAYDGVKYISPTILINHDDVAGETYIDYIVVREYRTDIPNSDGWYSTLNRNYYVPVVVKDASVTTFDNENLQRCTLNYIESKAKRTIE